MAETYNKYQKHGAYHWKIYKTDKNYQRHVDTIRRFFSTQKPGSLLDVGCGDGLISHVLASLSFDVHGIDVDEIGIGVAKSKSDLARFEIKRLEDITENYDYVLLSNVIEHVQDDFGILEKSSLIANNGTLVSTILKHPKIRKDPFHVHDYSEKDFIVLTTQVYKNVMSFVIYPLIYAWCVGSKGEYWCGG